MADLSQVREHMEIVGADGVHVGTVDKVDGDRIKMTKQDSGSHGGHHHYISGGLVAASTGRAIKKEVGDIDVDVDVRRTRRDATNEAGAR